MTHIEEFPVPTGEVRAKKRLSPSPHIHATAKVTQSDLGGWTDIGPHCSVGESSLGDYTYLAGHVSMIWTDVGKFTSIAAQTRINPGNHPTWRVTQHHCTYRRIQYGLGQHEDTEFFAWRRAHRCYVGHDVWIGHGVTVMAGKKIGNGAVIGAGAVVTRDIPPYAIAVGVPARVIKYRFTPDVIKILEETAWWDWDRATLEARFDELLDLEAFVARKGQPAPSSTLAKETVLS